MDLSVRSRRSFQTSQSQSWVMPQTAKAPPPPQRHPNVLRSSKPNSFIGVRSHSISSCGSASATIRTNSSSSNNSSKGNASSSSVVGILKRDVSLNRSFDLDVKSKFNNTISNNNNNNAPNLIQKRKNFALLKQSSVKDELSARIEKNGYIRAREFRVRNPRNPNSQSFTYLHNYGGGGQNKNNVLVAWSSNSSLMRAFNSELDQLQETINDRKNISSLSSPLPSDYLNRYEKKLYRSNTNTTPIPSNTNPTEYNFSEQQVADLQKINLNIVLPQTVETNKEKESNFSDVDSSSESPDRASNLQDKLPSNDASSRQSTKCVPIASVRRAHFQSSRSFAVSLNSAATATSTGITPNPTIEGGISKAIPARRRFPSERKRNTCGGTATDDFLVEPPAPQVVRRAMSAPVRSIDVSSRSIITACKPKPRRRKVISRNISCERYDIDFCDPTLKREKGAGAALLETNNTLNVSNTKTSRTRATSATTAAITGVSATTDVITLVSLISSDLSDSDREEDNNNHNNNCSEYRSECNTGRPHLRKTGKSVSFQETFVYTPSFQLAGKEYSHMIRRDSVAPLNSRTRSNRPPTAPAGTGTGFSCNDNVDSENMKRKPNNVTNDSIDNNDRQEADIDIRHKIDSNQFDDGTTPRTGKENNATATSTIPSQDEIYPTYVHSMKERECWKLFQKMCTKGVNVTYDTILRGMLTPTEFRQLQKQREIEETKRLAYEELDNANDNAKGSNGTTTIVADIKESDLLI